MSKEFKLVPLVANDEMDKAIREVISEEFEIDISYGSLSRLYDAILNAAPQPPEDPVVWGSPKTVGQLIRQLQTLDPALETVALYRLPDDIPGVGGKVKQGHISTSYERMEGIWLGPYKGTGRRVLAFWTKLDPREVPDGEPLTHPPALGGEPDSFVREVFLRNGFTIKEGQQDLKPYVYAAAKDLTAPLQAEIEQLKYDLGTCELMRDIAYSERAQIKARCDERGELLRESVGMVRGTVGNQDDELAERIEGALSKPAGVEQV